MHQLSGRDSGNNVKYAVAGLILIVGILVGYILHISQVSGIAVKLVEPADFRISYADMVVILLTVLGIFIAAGSILLAVLGFIGWQNLESKAMEVALKVTTERLDDGESKIHQTVKSAVAKAMYGEVLDLQDEQEGQ